MKKETVNIVIIGHVDHGKSTLIGRMLLATDSLPEGIDKNIELAYLADQLKEERERNITIDTTQIFFKTRRRKYCIIDAPGHVEFIKNMITGATLAEAAVLIVDVHEGVMEQTKRHAYIINMLGIDKVIVVLNKIDVINYDEGRINSVKEELLKFLGNLGIKPSFVVPLSAKEDVNIPDLLKALDSLKLDKKVREKPLRFPVQDTYEINNEKIIAGNVASGAVKRGEKIIFLPSHKNAKIKDVKIFGKRKAFAQEGESIGITLEGPLPIERGEVIVEEKNPPEPVNRFKGDIFWMSDEPLEINKRLTLRCATQEVGCVAEKIEKRIDSSTLKILEENAKELRLNEAGIVIFKTEKPVVIENFNFIEELGRFVIEREYNLQGAGIIGEKPV